MRRGVFSLVFWQPVLLILHWRLRLMVHTCTRSVPTLLSLVFALILGCPAAFAAAHLCDTNLHAASTTAPGTPPTGLLFLILIAIQGIYLVLRLPKSGVAVNHGIPAQLLRPYPIRTMQIVIADSLGDLLDLPMLFAIPVFVVVVRHVAGVGPQSLAAELAGGVGVWVVLLFFVLQTAVLSQLIQLGVLWIGASPRRSGLAMALLAFAVLASSLWSPPSANAVPVHHSGTPTTTPMAFAPWMAFLPAGLATQAVQSVSQGQPIVACFWGTLLAASFYATLWGADWCLRQTQQANPASVHPSRRKARPLSPRFTTPGLSIVAAAAGAEWRSLLRHPAAYLPLRGPALLLLTLIVSWVLANGSNDALVNLRDMTMMTALIYVVLCQLQLVCNRFGNDAETARFLFALPVPRRFLLLGKNLALLALLLPFDCALLGLACLDAHATLRLTMAILAGIGAALLLLTSLGNLLSVVAPFPIARRDDRFHVEPDRLLLFAYLLVLSAAALAPAYVFHMLAEWMPWPVAGIVLLLFLGGLYTGSLLLTERLLVRDELRILRALEGT